MPDFNFKALQHLVSKKAWKWQTGSRCCKLFIVIAECLGAVQYARPQQGAGIAQGLQNRPAGT